MTAVVLPIAVAPVSLFSATLLGLALAGLYVAHRLRSRPRERTTATLLFWQAAAKATQTRTLWSNRFRHLATFVLLAAALAGLAMSLSAYRWGDDAAQAGVIVVDAGENMSGVGEDGRPLFDTARQAIVTQLRASATPPAVITAGEQPIVHAAAGTPAAVTAVELSSLSPSPSASEPLQALALAGDLNAGPIDWYTTQTIPPIGLPAELSSRIRVRNMQRAVPVVSVVSSLIEPGPPGASVGQLRVRLAGRLSDGTVANVRAGIGNAVRGATVRFASGVAEAVFDDVASDGSSVPLTVDLPGQRAVASPVTVRLPRRAELTFRFGGNVPAALRDGLLAIGRQAAPEEAARIAVNTNGAAATIRTVAHSVSSKTQISSILKAADDRLSGLKFESVRVVSPGGLPGGVTPVLNAGGEAVAAFADDGRTLLLSEALLGSDADLPRHAVFPVLLRRLCDRLVGDTPAPPAVTLDRHALDPLWPTRSADLTLVKTAVPETQESSLGPPAVTSGVWPDFATLLLCGALFIVVIDCLLWAARKVV